MYYVEDPDLRKCFGYTIGLTLHHVQEFLMRGMDHEDTKMMLNGFVDSVLKNGEFLTMVTARIGAADDEGKESHDRGRHEHIRRAS